MRRGAQDEQHATQLQREDDDPAFMALMRHLRSRSRVRRVFEDLLLEGYVIVKRADLPKPAPEPVTPTVDLSRAVAAVHANRQSTAWPEDCIHPGSCSRHRMCMYTNCRHENRDISAEIDLSKR